MSEAWGEWPRCEEDTDTCTNTHVTHKHNMVKGSTNRPSILGNHAARVARHSNNHATTGSCDNNRRSGGGAWRGSCRGLRLARGCFKLIDS